MSSPGVRNDDGDGGPRVFEWLRSEVRPKVDARIHETLEEFAHSEKLKYQFDAGGKRLRPGLVLLVGRACGLSDAELLDVAAGVEILHTFTLIHDDVVDNDRVRRVEPAFWVVYGEDTAITLGDELLAIAISQFPSACIHLPLETSIRLAEGQQMGLEFESRRDVTEAQYMEMVRKKTGSLFELCIRAPQTLADADYDLTPYASLGVAFQLRDDLLDFEPGKGRRVGSDVLTGKRSLMVVHADDDDVYDVLDKPPAETTPEDVELVEERLRDHGSFEYVRRRMNELVEEALAALEPLPESEEAELLDELAAFLVERDR